jgi:hypothetical protein
MTQSNNITTGLAHPFVTQLTKIQDLGATTDICHVKLDEMILQMSSCHLVAEGIIKYILTFKFIGHDNEFIC